VPKRPPNSYLDQSIPPTSLPAEQSRLGSALGQDMAQNAPSSPRFDVPMPPVGQAPQPYPMTTKALSSPIALVYEYAAALAALTSTTPVGGMQPQTKTNCRRLARLIIDLLDG
jgi:hypothetical protein